SVKHPTIPALAAAALVFVLSAPAGAGAPELARVAASPKPTRAAARDSAKADSTQLVAWSGDLSGSTAATLEPWTRATLRFAGSAGSIRFAPPHVDHGPE